MNNWTTEQKNAINLRGKNVLVYYFAGSEKWLLIEMDYSKLIIEDKVDIDSFCNSYLLPIRICREMRKFHFLKLEKITKMKGT